MSPPLLARPDQRRKRALAHQCPECRRHWAMRAVVHPAGTAVLCGNCGYLAHPAVDVTGVPPTT
jgi:hypothetical protein